MRRTLKLERRNGNERCWKIRTAGRLQTRRNVVKDLLTHTSKPPWNKNAIKKKNKRKPLRLLQRLPLKLKENEL